QNPLVDSDRRRPHAGTASEGSPLASRPHKLSRNYVMRPESYWHRASTLVIFSIVKFFAKLSDAPAPREPDSWAVARPGSALNDRQDVWALSHYRQAWRRRDGGSVSGRGRAAGPEGGDQIPAGGVGGGPGAPAAFSDRGEGGVGA